LRTTNAIERLHEKFKRRIKTQCLLPCAETARDAVLVKRHREVTP
jgi:transposase-like protein